MRSDSAVCCHTACDVGRRHDRATVCASCSGENVENKQRHPHIPYDVLWISEAMTGTPLCERCSVALERRPQWAITHKMMSVAVP